jgi:type VI secretion system ImpM family protein
MIGLYGKIPSHGDFIRRNLPESFLMPWDQWLQDGLAFAQDALGDAFGPTWETAGVWRFRIGSGGCGGAAAEGVLVPSCDWVGRRFPLTVARLSQCGEAAMPAPWYEALAACVESVLSQGQRVDGLMTALAPFGDAAASGHGDAPAEGWWQATDYGPIATGLPPPDVFLSMVARTR